jgi:hypothetical protein
MFEWNEEKNGWLTDNRQITFEHIIVAIEKDGLLDILEHSNRELYPNRNIMAVRLGTYVYAVPFIEKPDGVFFLKTIFPGRKLTKQYVRSGDIDGTR